MLQSSQHSLPHRAQILRQRPAALVHKVLVELVPRVRDDVRELQCASQVPISKRPSVGSAWGQCNVRTLISGDAMRVAGGAGGG